MFYRGRLDGSARVLLIGQEGAQDESLSHRSFTGGTGARMQHLLTYIGVTRSYLFLNTFVYPIFGQYTGKLRGLAQNPISPIVEHRNRLFDKVADGDLRLVIAVGEAAKESVVTWIESHGGTADPAKLQTGLVRRPAVRRAVPRRAASRRHHRRRGPGDQGRLRPGRAQIGTWIDADASWLPPDAGADRDLTAAVLLRQRPAALSRLPVRHLSAARPRCHLVEPRGRPAQHPTVLGRTGSTPARAPSLTYSYTGTGTTGRVRRRLRRHPGRAAPALPAPLRPGPAGGLCAAADGRRGRAGLAGLREPRRHVRRHRSGPGAIYRGRFTSVSLLVLADPDAPGRPVHRTGDVRRGRPAAAGAS